MHYAAIPSTVAQRSFENVVSGLSSGTEAVICILTLSTDFYLVLYNLTFLYFSLPGGDRQFFCNGLEHIQVWRRTYFSFFSVTPTYRNAKKPATVLAAVIWFVRLKIPQIRTSVSAVISRIYLKG